MKRLLEGRMVMGLAASGMTSICVKQDLLGLLGALTIVSVLAWLAGEAAIYHTLWGRVLPRLNDQQLRDIVAIAEREK